MCLLGMPINFSAAGVAAQGAAGDLDGAIGSALSMRGRVYLSRGSRLGTTSGKREISASAPVILKNLRLEQRMILVLLTCQKQCCYPHRASFDYVAPCL
jgi:hypothetical protein